MSAARPSKIVPRRGDVPPDPTIRKDGNYRSRALLDLAHGIQECQLQLPGVCEGFSLEGCEPAHSNQGIHGKSAGMKAHDCFHVAACHSCHAELDQGHRFTQEEKAEFWQRGFERTILAYFKKGKLNVKA